MLSKPLKIGAVDTWGFSSYVLVWEHIEGWGAIYLELSNDELLELWLIAERL